MNKLDKAIIRLDAGSFYGLGHLSRCISIINEANVGRFLFLIKTDNEIVILDFLEKNFKNPFEVFFFTDDLTVDDEIKLILFHYKSGDLLIIDHYKADEDYQKKLFDKDVEWLQLDSHAKINFYAKWVMHGSPGATKELYKPLRKNKETEFLLGPKYCIIKDKVLNLANSRRTRNSLSKVVICFGGGDDREATIKCIESIDFESLGYYIKFRISISSYNKDYNKILSYQTRGFIELIEPEDLHLYMKDADLVLAAPGMISYEAAFLGLPMILITIADNQLINANAWEKYGCAINIGTVQDTHLNLNIVLSQLYKSPEKLQSMSENCLKLVDGKGVKRIIKKITKTIK